jgi:hypothetical protein
MMALASASVTDAAGQQIFYVKQKLFKLKGGECVRRRHPTRQLYHHADRILTFPPSTTSPTAPVLGSVR